METCVQYSRTFEQDFTNADSSRFNGVAERALGLLGTTTMASRIKASKLFPGSQLPDNASLQTEASHWACDALNRTAATANEESKSPYEMWHGSSLPVVAQPFLKPVYCKVNRENKPQAKTQKWFYFGPVFTYPRDSPRVLVGPCAVLLARNTTWQRASSASPAPAQTNDYK